MNAGLKVLYSSGFSVLLDRVGAPGVGPFGYGYFPYAGHATHGAGCGKYGFSYSAAGVVGSHNEHVANWCGPVGAYVAYRNARMTPQELVAFCEKSMSGHMVPRYLEFVPELPLTPTNKVEKYKLKQQAESRRDQLWDRDA